MVNERSALELAAPDQLSVLVCDFYNKGEKTFRIGKRCEPFLSRHDGRCQLFAGVRFSRMKMRCKAEGRIRPEVRVCKHFRLVIVPCTYLNVELRFVHYGLN
jgi:hypothetical protein